MEMYLWNSRMSDKAPATGLGSASQTLWNYSTNTLRIGQNLQMAQWSFLSLAVAERLNIQAEGSEFSWYIFRPFFRCQTTERSVEQAQKSYLFCTYLSIFESWWYSYWSECWKRWLLYGVCHFQHYLYDIYIYSQQRLTAKESKSMDALQP